MVSRDDSASRFAEFLTYIGQLGHEPKAIVIKTDNDPAYVGGDFKDICESQGIKQETTAPYRHTNAAVAERLWQTLLTIIRSLLFASPFGPTFWSLATPHSAYIYNRRPHAALEMTTPFENVHQYKPDLTRLRVWGCDAYAHIDEQHRQSKVAERSTHGIYIGHEEDSTSVRIYIPDTKTIIRSGDVKFTENIDQYGKVVLTHKNNKMFDLEETGELTKLPTDFDNSESFPDFSFKLSDILRHSTVYDDSETHGLLRVKTPQSPGGTWVWLRAFLDSNSKDSKGNYDKLAEYLKGQSHKTVTNTFYPIFAYCMVSTRKPGGAREPAIVISHDNRTERKKFGYMVGYASGDTQDVMTGQVIFPKVAAIVKHDMLNYTEPKSFEHSKSYPDADRWEEAVNEEVTSIVENKVIDPMDKEDIPVGKNIVDSKIVLKLKFHKDGTIERYKARLVALGFLQIFGLDFDDTFAPVSQLTTVRMVIALCLKFRIKPQHVDVKTAFLNSTLVHEIYIRLPKGVTVNGKSYGKLIKSLYGLKQAAHDWHQLQEMFILNFDSRFKKSSVDPCLFIIVDSANNLIVIISTHVDDYIIATNSDEWYARFIKAFGTRFEIKELGILDHILQMSINWNADFSSVTISQERFIAQLGQEHGLEDCKPIQTPAEANLHLTPCESFDSSLPFRSLIGSLLWIARASRPDILFIVIYLSRFSSCYGIAHWKAAKRVLRYLVTTSSRFLTFNVTPTEDPMDLIIYSDSDWAGDKNDRKSFSGSVVYLMGCAVSWVCKKQVTVALSSVEAEYMALSDCTKEALYAINLLGEFFEMKTPVSINIDNKGAGYIAENYINNKRTKHIDIRYHFVRQYIELKTIELFYVSTHENVADIFTKPLGPEVFNKLCQMLLRNA